MTNLTSQNTNQDTNKVQNMKNILFLVTGMTPQIITETVWALACDPANEEQWIPDEIKVLTTQSGINQIQKRLFEDGVFEQMKIDFPQISSISFDENKLIPITANKKVLEDIKTERDNEVMADKLCQTIRELTEDDTVALHVSIAGGRKTMGFYAGYALSLYGRAQDRLSHVLVEEQFEQANNFFYPTPSSRLVSDRDEKVVGDAKDAEVWLADIPFVRMKEVVNTHLPIFHNETFTGVVNKINESFNDVTLTILVKEKRIKVNDHIIEKIPAKQLALLHWFADSRKKGIDIEFPNADLTDDNEELKEVTDNFVEYYVIYKNGFNTSELKNEKNQTRAGKVNYFVNRKYLDEAKSRLKSTLKKNLGTELSAKLEIVKKDNKVGKFYLNINPDNINIITESQANGED